MASALAQTPEALYRDHGDWLFRWLRKRLGCEHDAADLTHDTYIRLIVSGRLPDAEASRRFLVRVAQGLAIDLHRRRVLERAYLETLAALPEPQMPSEEHRNVVLETLVEIDRALDGLPERARETFLLARFEGLTQAAIAARLGVSVAAVRKYMLKAAAATLAAVAAAESGTEPAGPA